MATAAAGTAPLRNRMSSARGQTRTRLNRNHISCFTSIHLSANHFLHLPFIFVIHPFIPAHSVHTFTAEWFNLYLLIICPHSSSLYVHIFPCLLSTRSAINLGSFSACELFPSIPSLHFLTYYISLPLRFKSSVPLKSFSSLPFHHIKTER